MSRPELAALIGTARNIVVFTGAGISTESGIPDFRSPGGVWSKMKPIYFQDFVASEERRREAWTRAFAGRAGWTGREPNAGHHAVARLVARGQVGAVITQNVDNLHQASGVPDEKIIELHGNASYATCLACGLRHELPQLKHEFETTGDVPTCRECGELVKTATISFGQAMPENEMRRARAATLACDLFLVLGSSLVVYPAAEFPLLAKRRGAALAIVNREPTDQDDVADLVVHAEIGPTLSQIVLGDS
ncbi:MAG: Sir2 family NAD-dependent protein deacetylase [Phenylobacterium sp.]|uniref:SIR2 family NAD-dependent protein deacylase n=1 Tax=Phenylobacterium sp. TaxID=1871053 RepID=UPI00271FF213|nr:Sir2 family NAD-dependent protein deacetylase [Phenylobacterium sp.]MDO8902844.1 Sir2 family NAD-dependent protein deacetylase [Phenylobacterium sp.]